MKRTIARILLVFSAPLVVLPQARPPEFEVASVRPSAPMPPSGGGANGRIGGPAVGGGCGIPRLTMDGGRVDYACIPLPNLIAYAFGIPQNRVAGPDWMADQRFDIVAKLPQGAPEALIPEMFQTLLADRFKLTIHRENKEQPVYALVVAKGGLKLKEALLAADAPAPEADPNAPPCPPQNFNCAPSVANLGGMQTRSTPLSPTTRRISNSRIGTALFTRVRPGEQRLEALNTTLEGLADLLTMVGGTGQPVMDMTGVKGRYQVVLEISIVDFAADLLSRAQAQADGIAPGPPDPTANPIVAALQEALKNVGLQLEPRKGPVETIVVDHLEKNPTAN